MTNANERMTAADLKDMNRIIFFVLFLCWSIVASAQDPALVKKAEAGDANAQYELANYYLPNTESVSAEGMKWLTKAAENGHAGAQWKLKCSYVNGWRGIQPDDEKYVYWLKKLANNTDLDNYKSKILDAQYDLGRLYKDGSRGVEKNISEFLKWEKKAAYNGHCPAAILLAYYYKREGDKQEAIYWHKKWMDIQWAKSQKVSENAIKGLRELGVTYHPADHVGKNNSSTATISPEDFYEYTEEFFTTPKTYYVEEFVILMFATATNFKQGVWTYKPGENPFSIKDNSIYVKNKFKAKYDPQLKDVIVSTSNGDVTMQMILFKDDAVSVDLGMRAIKFKDGHIIVYEYVKNKKTGKYTQEDYYDLYKE